MKKSRYTEERKRPVLAGCTERYLAVMMCKRVTFPSGPFSCGVVSWRSVHLF
jgi:hypothetical protein